MSKSALAITEEHNDLADAANGLLSRLNSRAAARATLENGTAHPSEIWSAGRDLGWNGLALAEQHGGSGFGRRIGDRARGPRPRTVARAVPAHRRGGSGDRPLRT